MKRSGIILLLACLFAGAGLVRAAELPLSDEARAAVERGRQAAEQDDWELAALFFDEAERNDTFGDPRLFYSLGIAHGQAGHVLPAAGWLQACIIARPSFPDADAIHRKIERLDRIALEDQRRIFTMAFDAARGIPVANVKWNRLICLARDLARCGDLESARATAEEAHAIADAASRPAPGEPSNIRVLDREHCEALILESFSMYQAETGDLIHARESADKIMAWGPLLSALSYLAVQQELSDPGPPKSPASGWLAALNPDAPPEPKRPYEQSFADAEYCVSGGDWDDDRERVQGMLKLAAAYAAVGRVDDWRRILDGAKASAENKQFGDLLADVEAVLATDPSKLDLRNIWTGTPVAFMVVAAQEWSANPRLLDTRDQVENALQATAADSPFGCVTDGISLRLELLAKTVGVARSRLRGLGTRMAVTGFQIRLLEEHGQRNCRDPQDRRIIFEGRNMGRLPIVSQDDIVSAEGSVDPATQDLIADLTLTEEGQARLEKATAANIGGSLVIIFDGHIFSTPVIKEAITGEKVRIVCTQADFEANRQKCAERQLHDFWNTCLSITFDDFYGGGRGLLKLESAFNEHQNDPSWTDADRETVRKVVEVKNKTLPDYKDGTFSLMIDGRTIMTHNADILSLSGKEIVDLAEAFAGALKRDEKWGPIFKRAGEIVFGAGNNQ